jgi:hypothetical protein
MTTRKLSATNRWLFSATLVVCGLPVTATYAAGRVFFEGFEAGNTASFAADGTRERCVATRSSVDQKPARAGSYMAECNWNGVVAWNDSRAYSSLKLPSWNYSREFLIRGWVRYAADVDHAMGAKLMRLLSDDGSNSFYLGAQMERSGGPVFVYWERVNGRAGPLSYGEGTAAGDGAWHKIEVYTKHNAPGQSDGVLRMWLDGNVVLEQQGLITSSSEGRWYPFYLMSNWSNNPGWEHDANNHVYWDDVEIYSDTGTGASGSLANASITVSSGTAPAPPQALSAQ